MASKKGDAPLDKCCNCGSSVGDSAKVQPTRVFETHHDSATARPEVWCPRCFVWVRMVREPERFNASNCCAGNCQFCGWTVVCMGGNRSGLLCSNCFRPGVLKAAVSDQDLKELRKIAEETAEEVRAKL